VPLDPQYPEAKLQEVVTDLGIATIICSSESAERLSSYGFAKILTIDGNTAYDTFSTKHPCSVVAPQDVAVLTFTSGTTGKSL
jgi:non-ribosomal peptide synthetase component F